MAFRSMLAKDAWCYKVKRLSRPGYGGSELFAMNRSTVLIAYIHISYMYIQMYTCISYIYICIYIYTGTSNNMFFACRVKRVMHLVHE